MPGEHRSGLSGRLWRVAGPDDAPTIPDLDAPPFVGRLLRRRGVDNAAQAERFLNPDQHTPNTQLDGIDHAVERIMQAARDRETVAVYGDYDVDGVTATTILHEALTRLGVNSRWFIPNRREHGYGLHEAQLERLAAEGASLIITADCGITANDLLSQAEDRFGLQFIVVDHHTPGPSLPQVAALVAPHTEPGRHPLAELSTGGLAWHLAHALMRAAALDTPTEHWLDLAALSAIADVVPLSGENRRLVHAGLRSLSPIERPGLAALAALGPPGPLDAEAVSFQIAPRINAAGRLEDASLAVELLLSETATEAKQRAKQLDELNRRRRQLSDQAFQRALSQVERQSPNGAQPLILFAGDEHTHPGVVGIIAGRLVDRFHRPAFAYSVDNGVAQASGRAPAPYDLAAMLANCSDLLLRHGGHARAAAFSAETQHLPALLERLHQTAEASLHAASAAPPEPALEIDGRVPLDALHPDHVRWINRLAPFGAANPTPLFLSENIKVAEARTLGKDHAHLRLKLAPRHPAWRAPHWPAVAWRQGQTPIHPGQHIDIVWTLRRDRNHRPELEIQDLSPH